MKSSVPVLAHGSTVPAQKGYLVEEIRDRLYWVSDGTWNTMFLTYDEGVISVDAPLSMSQKYYDAIREVSNKPITHLIYSHSHSDHTAGAHIFSETATYISHKETAETLKRRKDFRRPIPEITFLDNYELKVSDQILILDYNGPNHEPGNIFVYAPRQKVLLLKDIIYPGWTPFRGLGGIVNDVPGYIEAHNTALNYDFDVFVGGHVNRLGNREDVSISREFVLDLKLTVSEVLKQVDFAEISRSVDSEDRWMIFETYFNTVVRQCSEIMIPKWEYRLCGAKAFMDQNCWAMMRSLVLDFSPDGEEI